MTGPVWQGIGAHKMLVTYPMDTLGSAFCLFVEALMQAVLPQTPGFILSFHFNIMEKISRLFTSQHLQRRKFKKKNLFLYNHNFWIGKEHHKSTHHKNYRWCGGHPVHLDIAEHLWHVTFPGSHKEEPDTKHKTCIFPPKISHMNMIQRLKGYWHLSSHNCISHKMEI